MNPESSPNNSTNFTFVNSPQNTGQPGTTGMHFSTNPQFRARMEQPLSVGQTERNNNQTNYQPHQNSPHQYYQVQQNNQRLQPNLVQQQPQQNLRFTTDKILVRPPTISNHNNSNFQPKVSSDEQRMQMTPPITSSNPQQSIRPFLNNSNAFNESNLPNQSLKMEPSKAPIDRPQPTHQNVLLSENYKTENVINASANLLSKSSDLETNSPSLLTPNQAPREITNKFCTDVPNSGNIKKRSDSVNEKPSPLRREESKTESESSIESNLSEDCDLKSVERKPNKDIKTKKKNQKEIILKDDGITSGMVQKNIKFFEQNDTAKKPLRPKTLTDEKIEKTAKMPSNLIKSNFSKNEFECGVDETPVVHPNLGSIFQIPRKVAKIPFLKENKRHRKFKSKLYFEEISNKKNFHKKPTFTQFLRPPHSYSYKSGGKKNQNIKTYNSEEELLSFFENTNSWRRLNRYGSKTNEKATKDKVAHKPTTNGDIPTPKKTPSKVQPLSKKNPPVSPVKIPLKSPGTPGTPGAKLLPKTPESSAPPTPLIKKVPMNKIQVGAAPSPNLKTIRSKVGSLANTTHKPGGGNIKIESHKIDLSNVQPRTEAKNDQYKPSGGDKKIQQVKLQWSAKSKVGSLENSTYKPGGGDKKIESVKLDFKEKAKSKVGSKDNAKHVPGGGNVKIENQKLEFRAQSKVGSLDNVKHKPGGGDIKIFDDKTYLRQVSGNSSEGRASGTQEYRNLSVEQENKKSPRNPGRRTSIKVKKITEFVNPDVTQKIQKVTEGIVTSQTSKTDEEIDKSSNKVKVTYSKISALNNQEVADDVELIKMPAKHHTPVLKPSLGEKDTLDNSETGKQLKLRSQNVKNPEIFKQTSESSNLLQDKPNKRDEMVTQERTEEIWQGRNVPDKSNLPNGKPHDEQRKQLTQNSILSNPTIKNHHQQLRFPNPNIKTDDSTIDMRRNVYSNQSFQAENISQNPSFSQSQTQNSQRTSSQSSAPEEYRISGLQQNQFRQNPLK